MVANRIAPRIACRHPRTARRCATRHRPPTCRVAGCMLVAMTNACRLRRAAPAPLASPVRARPVLLWTGVALLSLAADAGTKAWALAALRHGHEITVAGGLLRLQLVANHGAAFGIGAGYEPLIVVVSVAGVVLLGVWAHFAAGNTSRFGAALA